LPSFPLGAPLAEEDHMTEQEMAARMAQLEAMLAELLTRTQGATSAPPASPPARYGAVPYGSVPPGTIGPEWVWTPQGRRFPPPKPELGEMFIGYTQRVGRELGGAVADQATRTAGGLFISATPLLQKHGGDWVAACEEHLFGNPNYRPDPAWASYRPGP
jgi:hypothetical protein